MIISVFGLRDYQGKEYTNYAHIASTLDTFEGIDQLVSGGGKGIESLAARYASDSNIPVRIIPPNIQDYGQEVAFRRRNREILECSDVPIVFWDGESHYYAELVKDILLQKKACYVVPIL